MLAHNPVRVPLSLTFTHDALGTRFFVEIHDEVTVMQREKITADIGHFLTQFEKRYSRFLFDSVVSTLNRERAIPNPDKEFVTLLECGRSLSARTQGLFNILLGGTLEGRGYDSTYSFVPSVIKESNHPNPLTDLEIAPESITLHNGNLDLGGFGKGYVIDLLATHLQETFNLHYFLINGGGDIYGTSNYGAPFTIYLEHPLAANTFLGTTEILNQGFAASSPHKRSWVHNGTTYTHIVNTKCKPQQSTLYDASFVITDTCVEADAFATIALMVKTKECTSMAEENKLAFATFTFPSTLTTNSAFIVQSL